MKNYLIAFVLICLACSFTKVAGQDAKPCHKYIPYFRSLNAQKLAVRLTSHLGSDSAKVCAIHSWITHHIKYDYKKFSSFNYDKAPVKKILRRRKAVSWGYAALFNELCNYSGINSTVVEGYLRNTNTDVNDGFYMEDHSWNAVKINGGWKLIDVCLDAGYIKYYRKTFTGNLLYGVSFGVMNLEKYHPHFFQKPSLKYFNKNGNFFICDHIPADPEYQLLTDIRKIESLENDSCFYFNNKKKDESISNNRQINPSINKVEYGFITYQFNHKNQYHVGNSFRILALDIYSKTNFRSKDTVLLNDRCDSIMIYTARAIFHNDSNSILISHQKEELNSNNRKKKEMMATHTNFLVGSSKQALRLIENGVKTSRQIKATTNKIVKSTRENNIKLESYQSYHKSRAGITTKVIDSTDLSKRIALNKDSISDLEQTILKRIETIHLLYDSAVSRITSYTDYSGKSTTLTQFAILRRMENYDDLDYPVRMVKDTVLAYKFRSLGLLMMDNTFIITRLNDELNFLEKDYKRSYTLHYKTLRLYTTFKRSVKANQQIDESFQTFLASYKRKMDLYNRSISSLKTGTKQLNSICRSSVQVMQKEFDSYNHEKSIESHHYKVRSKFINKKQASLIKLNNKQKRECLKMYNKALNTKQRIAKKAA